MSLIDKIKNKLQMGKGHGKAGVGRVTGDAHLEAEGKRDHTAGGFKQAGEHAKDASKSVRKSFEE